MLDDDGNIRTIESKSKHIVKEGELYNPVPPSVDSVDPYINSMLVGSYENDDSHKHIICHHGAEQNAQMMVNNLNNWVINGKIYMAIGSTIDNNHPCPLFSTTLSKLEDSK